MNRMSDIEVLQVFTSSPSKALEEIYRRYASLVYGVCLKYLNSREDSLDEVTEIFTELPQKIANSDILNFRSWLYSVTKNHCLMRLRKEQRIENALSEYIYNEQIESESPDIIKYPSHLIEDAICMLSPEQKLCVEMFYYEKKTYAEITHLTGFDHNSVKSYLQNGKIKLKKILEERK